MKSRKLKINYRRQNRIPEGAAQLTEQEKQAQKRAQKQPQKRHQLQDFDLVTVDVPSHFPAFDNDFTLHDADIPDIDLMIDNFIAKGIIPKFNSRWDWPKLNELMLKKLKFDLSGLYDSAFNYFGGFGYPAVPTLQGNETYSEEEKSEEYRDSPHWKSYYDNRYGTVRALSSYNGIWAGEYNWEKSGNVLSATFLLTAAPDSAITDDYVTIPEMSYHDPWSDRLHEAPIEFTEFPSMFYNIQRVYYWGATNWVPPDYPITEYEARLLPKGYPLPTDISITKQDNVISISEAFTKTTTETKCNQRRWIKILLVGDCGKPVYTNWRRKGQVSDRENEEEPDIGLG